MTRHTIITRTYWVLLWIAAGAGVWFIMMFWLQFNLRDYGGNMTRPGFGILACGVIILICAIQIQAVDQYRKAGMRPKWFTWDWTVFGK